MSTKTASDSSLTYFRLFLNLSFSCPTWLNKLKFTENQFFMFRPLYSMAEKNEVNKKSILSSLS